MSLASRMRGVRLQGRGDRLRCSAHQIFSGIPHLPRWWALRVAKTIELDAQTERDPSNGAPIDCLMSVSVSLVYRAE
jgi:hypothetical protein